MATKNNVNEGRYQEVSVLLNLNKVIFPWPLREDFFHKSGVLRGVMVTLHAVVMLSRSCLLLIQAILNRDV